jgi:hypothetical protein
MTNEKVCDDVDIFVKSLCMMFSVKWLRDAAKRTGFIKRERKISPEVFFWVLVLGSRTHITE